MNGFTSNPLLNIGLGILGANGPGVSAGQAIGRGGMLGLNNFAKLKMQEERAKFRQLQAEAMMAEMARAKKEAERQAEFLEKAEAFRQGVTDPGLKSVLEFTDPSDYGKVLSSRSKEDESRRRFEATFGMDQSRLDLERQRLAETQRGTYNVQNAMLPGAKGPTQARENNKTGRLEVMTANGWQEAPPGTRLFSTTAQGSNEDVGLGLNKTVQSQVQQNLISADLAASEAEKTRQLVESNPNVVGMFARFAEKASGVINSAGQFFGSEALQQAADAVRPLGKSGASATDVQAALLATKTAAREIMAPDKGPLTQQEQADYKEALGMLESSDANIIQDGLESLIGVMDRRANRLKEIARISGLPVPGEAPLPRINSPEELKTLKPGDQFVGPDGVVRTYK